MAKILAPTTPCPSHTWLPTPRIQAIESKLGAAIRSHREVGQICYELKEIAYKPKPCRKNRKPNLQTPEVS